MNRRGSQAASACVSYWILDSSELTVNCSATSRAEIINICLQLVQSSTLLTEYDSYEEEIQKIQESIQILIKVNLAGKVEMTTFLL